MSEQEQWREEKKRLVEEYHKRNLTAVKGGIDFVGSSLMEMFPIEQWVGELPQPKPVVYNRGVGGYKTTDLIPILDICVYELEPRKVFINIGTNDLSDSRIPMSEIISNYETIISRIEQQLPETQIYCMAYYPVNYDAAAENMKECLKIRSNEKISLANEEVRKLADRHGKRFININRNLMDNSGNLKAEYTIEGLHINHDGYRAIFDDLMKYVME